MHPRRRWRCGTLIPLRRSELTDSDCGREPLADILDPEQYQLPDLAVRASEEALAQSRRTEFKAPRLMRPSRLYFWSDPHLNIGTDLATSVRQCVWDGRYVAWSRP